MRNNNWRVFPVLSHSLQLSRVVACLSDVCFKVTAQDDWLKFSSLPLSVRLQVKVWCVIPSSDLRRVLPIHPQHLWWISCSAGIWLVRFHKNKTKNNNKKKKCTYLFGIAVRFDPVDTGIDTHRARRGKCFRRHTAEKDTHWCLQNEVRPRTKHWSNFYKIKDIKLKRI